MIDFTKLPPNWEFELPGYGCTQTGHQCFNFKSPRMKEPRHYNAIIQPNTNEGLLEYERECYLNQLMFNVSKQLGGVESDIKRQLKIHVDRDLPIPPELGVDIKLKLV